MSEKGVRIHDLARRLAVPTKELITFLESKGVTLQSKMGSIDGSTADMVLQAFGANATRSQKADTTKRRRTPIGRTFTPPKHASAKQRRSIRRTPAEMQEAAPATDAEKRDNAVAESPKSKGSSSRGKSQPRRKPGRTFEPPKSNETQQAATGKRTTSKAQEAGQKKTTSAKRGRTFAPSQQPDKPSGKPSGRQRPKRGRTFTPDSAAPGSEKSTERGASKPRGSGTQEATPGTERKTKRKRDASRRGAGAQARTTDGKAAGQDKKPTDASAKTGTNQSPRRRGKGASTTSQNSRTRPGSQPSQQRARSKGRRQAPVKTAPQRPETPPQPVEEKPKRVRIPEVIMLKELADQMDIHPAQIIRHLMGKGILANVNQMLEPDAAKSIAESFEFEVEEATVDDLTEQPEEAIDEASLQLRPPVVTIMGHVDHGKTTLLDAIRESKVADSEFGGITQHIGAYVVNMRDQKVVFLDTPGHEAFTAMRARGAQVTDEVILVVAADDGIMPQTIEAIDHAKAAEVPIIVAINKIDLPGANPDRVMQELTKHGLTPEDWGGETICVKVSAKQQTNLDDLLEMILLQAEMLELKANPDTPAKGVVVEAMLDKGRGPVATVLVRSGTLRVGDAFVAGLYHGKVRAMFDDRGKPVKEAGPSIPVEVLGISGVPTAGDGFGVVENDRKARQIAEKRQEEQQKKEFLKTGKITLEELHNHIKDGSIQELRIIIKADVHGSVEALSDALARLSTNKVRLQVIHGGVGAINETDVMLAAAESNAIVLGFNVRPVAKAREVAEKEQIDMRLYTIIYQAIEDIKKAMEGLLEPTYKEVLQGQANVQATFSVPKIGVVAGCRVVQGKVTRNSIVKLFRDHKEVYKGTLASLRRVKDDVREVANGYECGIKLENYNDIKEGDIIESYALEKVTMTLEEATRQQ